MYELTIERDSVNSAQDKTCELAACEPFVIILEI
jgi:hypothetical protein